MIPCPRMIPKNWPANDRTGIINDTAKNRNGVDSMKSR